MRKKLLLLIFLTLSGAISLAEETIIEVIPLFNRPPSEILPLLSPLLEDTDRVLADGTGLLVKTRPDRLGDIIMLIEKLDAPLNNLVITVIQSRHATAEELNAAARANLNFPRNERLKYNGKITGHYYQTEDQYTNERTQTIRTLEGSTAYIATGNTYPIENVQIYNSGYGYPAVSATTEFVDTTTGFAVIPRLAGQSPTSAKEQVIVDVSPWSEKVNRQGQFETHNVQSTIKINLGEWVELGGSDENSHSNINRNLATIRQTNQNRLRILVKVEKAD